MPRDALLSADELAGLSDLTDWQVIDRTLVAAFRSTSFAGAGRFVAVVAAEADAADHHPDVDLRYPGVVRIESTTHDSGGITARDADLARTISRLAAESGAQPTPLES